MLLYNESDVGSFKDIHIDPRYWAEAGTLFNAPAYDDVLAYTKAYAEGLVMGDLEGVEMAGIYVNGCKNAIHIVKGARFVFSGSLYEVHIDQCLNGIKIDDIDNRWGLLVCGGEIYAEEYAVHNRTAGPVKLRDVKLRGKTLSADVTEADMPSDVDVDLYRSYQKPPERVYKAALPLKGDCAPMLNRMLARIGGSGGGVVYVPAGWYTVSSPVIVPANTELRGSSSVAQRDQNENHGGTIFIVRYGVNTSRNESFDADTYPAAFQLIGEYAGLNGLEMVYPGNHPNNLMNAGYCVRGEAKGVYAVNCCIVTADNGIDFRGCDDHFIKRIISCCYTTVVAAGDCTGGHIEGNLQNGTVHTFCITPGLVSDLRGTENLTWELFDPITRKQTVLVRLNNARNQTVLHTFAYGAYKLVISRDSYNVMMVNVGIDNMGTVAPMFDVEGGSLHAANVMRFNGLWYKSKHAVFTLCNASAIGYGMLDSVSLTGNEPPIAVPEPVVISDCDTAGRFHVEGIERENVKQGTGAWRANGKHTLLWEGTYGPVDASAHMDNGYLTMWIWCEDIRGLGEWGEIELGSGGTCDKNEYYWFVNDLVTGNGWNRIAVPLNSGNITDGKPDLSALNYFRIYTLDAYSNFIIDDVKIVDMSALLEE